MMWGMFESKIAKRQNSGKNAQMTVSYHKNVLTDDICRDTI